MLKSPFHESLNRFRVSMCVDQNLFYPCSSKLLEPNFQAVVFSESALGTSGVVSLSGRSEFRHCRQGGRLSWAGYWSQNRVSLTNQIGSSNGSVKGSQPVQTTCSA